MARSRPLDRRSTLLRIVSVSVLLLNQSLAKHVPFSRSYGSIQRRDGGGCLTTPRRDASSAIVRCPSFVGPLGARKTPPKSHALWNGNGGRSQYSLPYQRFRESAPFLLPVRDSLPWSGRPGAPIRKNRCCRSFVHGLMASSIPDIKNETPDAATDENIAEQGSSVTNRASNTGGVNENQGYRTLYPPLQPNRNGTLEVDSLHTLFYEEYGRNPANEADLDTRSPRMKTALFLHGGPGAACFPNHARFFDPALYRIVLFDQRGCGRSSPRGETRNNTLAHLVRDCEALRAEMGVGKWDVVLGGSWGVTLALAYAQEFPESVGSMVLRGVCALRPQEVDWLFGRDGGASALNPAGWKEFEEAVGLGDNDMAIHDTCSGQSQDYSDRSRMALHTYYDCLLGEDPMVRLHAARAWFKYEMGVSARASISANGDSDRSDEDPAAFLFFKKETGWTFYKKNGKPVLFNSLGQSASQAVSNLPRLQLATTRTSPSFGGRSWENLRPSSPQESVSELVNMTLLNCTAEAASQFVPAQAMLTCFYSVNDKYMMQNFDLFSKERMERIRHIPCIAVQGGSDAICPPDTALDLHRVWPEMELRVPISSGHSMYDPAITSELVKATDYMAEIVSQQ